MLLIGILIVIGIVMFAKGTEKINDRLQTKSGGCSCLGWIILIVVAVMVFAR